MALTVVEVVKIRFHAEVRAYNRLPSFLLPTILLVHRLRSAKDGKHRRFSLCFFSSVRTQRTAISSANVPSNYAPSLNESSFLAYLCAIELPRLLFPLDVLPR